MRRGAGRVTRAGQVRVGAAHQACVQRRGLKLAPKRKEGTFSTCARGSGFEECNGDPALVFAFLQFAQLTPPFPPPPLVMLDLDLWGIGVTLHINNST